MNDMNSEKIFLKYLNGDSSISLEDIKRFEKEERFKYLMSKFSLNKPLLKVLVLPFVFVFSICFDSSY